MCKPFDGQIYNIIINKTATNFHFLRLPKEKSEGIHVLNRIDRIIVAGRLEIVLYIIAHECFIQFENNVDDAKNSNNHEFIIQIVWHTI